MKHVAEHMREISLAALPQNLEPNEDDSEDEFDDFVSAPEIIPKRIGQSHMSAIASLWGVR